MTTDGFTSQIAARSAALGFEDLPDDVVELARQCVLDWMGVTVAGSAEPCARLLVDELADAGATGRCTLVGRSIRATPADAALVNGTASHALDYDDVNEAMLGHPTVPILAGLLALAEHVDASGRDVVTAFVAGYEAQCSIGRAVGAEHYQRGFHATGTVGTFGATAACGRLLGLDPDAMEVALGLAAAQAAGLKSMFGTMTKPLHAGRASANGVWAARLASRGFTAARQAVETVQGFAETHTADFDPERGLRPAPRDWWLRQNLFKYHAACFQTHSSIEGLRRLREELSLGADEVAAVTIHASPAQLRMCAIPEPVTGLEVKFSLRHTAAMALTGRDTSAIGSFADSVVADPDVLAVRDRVAVVGDGSAAGPTAVDVELKDGRVVHAAHDVSRPEADLDRQRRLLTAKFEGLAGPILGPDRAGSIAADAARLDQVESVRPLLGRLAGA